MATRQFEGNLYREVTEADIKKGIRVCDDTKVGAELREIFTHISFADPSITQQFGNFDANVIAVTTPKVANVEFAVKHSLGRIPVGCFGVLANVAAVTGGVSAIPILELSGTAWDATYVYLSTPNPSYTFGLVVW